MGAKEIQWDLRGVLINDNTQVEFGKMKAQLSHELSQTTARRV